ncbi:MAG: alanine transaminase [Sulfurimonas sp. RIFOXYD12_FULL_33_39]|uniref:LL-diaminopimelate aminotransferase n=1 Tax=unclassified Sulfurimonas TaxID=2623549 RepID=UPI0008CD72B6|nr:MULTISPECIES: LL-diaminopimelate aminotransferase [unclassified Sulfurimonas]OHE02774.1 MAG: alanine transaminase [Sulfurimonas sp. RIFCSPLOWO2_12_FULL_34_6]OHE09784.1 MAG: alanine transaminase [Sulfurimonas sp. RIFOXYD12_FULL_33_39]OHE13708.1 MAG: alanine transaminase [Sulfurimonas sp. RIFOXYD2_FULL_34_21]DAB28077.1 MAG TPA: alanine transaminase [Sulfurimonas sp. UBA10385]
MFDEIQFDRIKKLPEYVFAEVNALKMAARRAGADVIDFSMGNPDGDTPEHIREKLIESAQKTKTHGYSTSKGIPKLLVAISDWYKRRYGCDLDPMSECVATIGSKEGYAHLTYAITNPGDVAVMPDPTYPIHEYSFILAGGNVVKFAIEFDEDYKVKEDKFFEDLTRVFRECSPKPKYVLVNFPHNPTTATVTQEFYIKLVAMAKEKRFYIISDIAYGDITFDGYVTPSIMSVEGAKDVAVESFTLSKSYNMAGWRVGFFVGNKKLIGALQKIKSWLDYGMFTPIQVAATIALNGDQQCVRDITDKYNHRQEILLEAFDRAGWHIRKNQASMFVWAKLPECCAHLGSLEFSKRLLTEAHVAVAPGIGFGESGDGYVRIALIENDNRIRQAARNIKEFLKQFQDENK